MAAANSIVPTIMSGSTVILKHAQQTLLCAERIEDAAVMLMNDSEFGLTASIWTSDKDRTIKLGDQVETGTFFMNRCDYLDAPQVLSPAR